MVIIKRKVEKVGGKIIEELSGLVLFDGPEKVDRCTTTSITRVFRTRSEIEFHYIVTPRQHFDRFQEIKIRSLGCRIKETIEEKYSSRLRKILIAGEFPPVRSAIGALKSVDKGFSATPP